MNQLYDQTNERKITILNHLIYTLVPALWLIISYEILEPHVLWMPKEVIIGVLFIILAAVSVLFARSGSDSKQKIKMQMLFSVIEMILILWLIFSSSNFEHVLIEKVVSFIVGIIIYFMSFSFIGLKRNAFLGVKTPGAVESDAIWNQTHKVSAITWPIGSLFLFGQLFWDKPSFSVPILLISAVFILLIPLSLSYQVE